MKGSISIAIALSIPIVTVQAAMLPPALLCNDHNPCDKHAEQPKQHEDHKAKFKQFAGKLGALKGNAVFDGVQPRVILIDNGGKDAGWAVGGYIGAEVGSAPGALVGGYVGSKIGDKTEDVISATFDKGINLWRDRYDTRLREANKLKKSSELAHQALTNGDVLTHLGTYLWGGDLAVLAALNREQEHKEKWAYRDHYEQEILKSCRHDSACKDSMTQQLESVRKEALECNGKSSCEDTVFIDNDRPIIEALTPQQIVRDSAFNAGFNIGYNLSPEKWLYQNSPYWAYFSNGLKQGLAQEKREREFHDAVNRQLAEARRKWEARAREEKRKVAAEAQAQLEKANREAALAKQSNRDWNQWEYETIDANIIPCYGSPVCIRSVKKYVHAHRLAMQPRCRDPKTTCWDEDEHILWQMKFGFHDAWDEVERSFSARRQAYRDNSDSQRQLHSSNDSSSSDRSYNEMRQSEERQHEADKAWMNNFNSENKSFDGNRNDLKH